MPVRLLVLRRVASTIGRIPITESNFMPPDDRLKLRVEGVHPSNLIKIMGGQGPFYVCGIGSHPDLRDGIFYGDAQHQFFFYTFWVSVSPKGETPVVYDLNVYASTPWRFSGGSMPMPAEDAARIERNIAQLFYSRSFTNLAEPIDPSYQIREVQFGWDLTLGIDGPGPREPRDPMPIGAVFRVYPRLLLPSSEVFLAQLKIPVNPPGILENIKFIFDHDLLLWKQLYSEDALLRVFGGSQINLQERNADSESDKFRVEILGLDGVSPLLSRAELSIDGLYRGDTIISGWIRLRFGPINELVFENLVKIFGEPAKIGPNYQRTQPHGRVVVKPAAHRFGGQMMTYAESTENKSRSISINLDPHGLLESAAFKTEALN